MESARFPTPRQTRVALIALFPLATVIGTALGPTMFARADYTPTPGAFVANQVLSAQTIVDEFAKVQSAINHPTITRNGKTFGTAALYCGLTPATPGRITDVPTQTLGWDATKVLCSNVSSCSPTAHICSGEELFRSMNVGVEPPLGGWYAATVSWAAPDILDGVGTTKSMNCAAWATDANDNSGAWWGPQIGPSYQYCDSSQPVLCCD